MARSDTNKALNSLVNEPKNKDKILGVLRQYFPMYQNIDDDAAWSDLSLENKINYLKFALKKGNKK